MSDPAVVASLDEISLWSAPFGLRLLDAVRYRRNISVLDVGFGTGFPLLELAMRLGDGSALYGIDPWQEAVAHTRAKMMRYGIGNVQLIAGRGEEIPLPAESIDLIVSNNGMNNVQDVDRVLAECARVARSGAQLLATMNLDTTMMEFYTIMEEVLHKHSLDREIQIMKQHIREKRKPLGEVQSLLEKNGFAVQKILNDEFRYAFASGSALLRHYFIRLAFLGAWKEIVPGAKRRTIFDEIEERLNEKADRTGTLHLSVPFVLIECERIGRGGE